ncbi:MAG TPA: NAD(+)/NADH kinase [Bacillota bacterium]|nr:NAD(+)/NADH kinase [Bacillota bacterium]HOK68499.1 NAD(+)/NADH kinase [Bacillota bacterium]HPP85127.1 NAD(+)/NADH kinase [Bacillota bacterium]
MKKQIEHALLYPNIHREFCSDFVATVTQKLHSLGIKTILAEEKRQHISTKADVYLPEKEAFAACDICIVLGGDGTMLSAAHIACSTDTPLLGINLGTLGYMSELELEELDLLDKLKTGFEYADRMMIDITCTRNGAELETFTALNEAIITRGAIASMLGLTLICDGSKVNRYRADGLIIATPTGSSAYSMSAGGPIIDTKLDAFCVCPICSYSLAGSRALIFAPHSVIEIEPYSEKGGDIVMTADGRYSMPLKDYDRVVIRKSRKKTRFIKLKKDAFYDVLNRKLG